MIDNNKNFFFIMSSERLDGEFVAPYFCPGVIGNSFKLFYVKNQTDELCMVEVNDYGFKLQYVKKQTEEICLAAVKGNNTSVMSAKLMHVWPEFQEACKDAIKNSKLNKSKKR